MKHVTIEDSRPFPEAAYYRLYLSIPNLSGGLSDLKQKPQPALTPGEHLYDRKSIVRGSGFTKGKRTSSAHRHQLNQRLETQLFLIFSSGYAEGRLLLSKPHHLAAPLMTVGWYRDRRWGVSLV